MIEHRLHAVHVVGTERAAESAIEFDGIEVRRLRSWVEQHLRQDDSTEARELFKLLGMIVYWQGYYRGMDDALEFGEHKGPSIAGVYKDGYDTGHAEGMSRKAGEL